MAKNWTSALAEHAAKQANRHEIGGWDEPGQDEFVRRCSCGWWTNAATKRDADAAADRHSRTAAAAGTQEEGR